ncbi:MAG: Ig-like domain-containing protein, partial [Clostridia bacterium]|nr:Ig-like domain-containing protein [Clostridia bacterium]
GTISSELENSVGSYDLTSSEDRQISMEVVDSENMVPVESLNLNANEITLHVGETFSLAKDVQPSNASVKALCRVSSNDDVATVDYNGLIKAEKVGITTVTVTSIDSSDVKEECIVNVVPYTTSNSDTIVLDYDNYYIYGVAPKTEQIDTFLNIPENTSIKYSNDGVCLGTSSEIEIVDSTNKCLEKYQVLIFGDVNGDGIYDGQDATIVNCIANGLLTGEQIGEAKYTAADCNHDGSVDSSDVLILEQAGLLLANVDQSKDDYMESDAYAEYLDLIDQNPTIDETPETPDEPDAPAQTPVSFLAKIIEIIKTVIEFFRSLAVKF